MCTTHRKKKKRERYNNNKGKVFSDLTTTRRERKKKKRTAAMEQHAVFSPLLISVQARSAPFFPSKPRVCVCFSPPPPFFLLLFCLSPVFLSLLTGSTAPAPPPHPRRPDHACCGSKPAAPSRAKTAASNPTRCVRRPSPTCSAPRPGDAESTPP